jgi:hypothetical protein
MKGSSIAKMTVAFLASIGLGTAIGTHWKLSHRSVPALPTSLDLGTLAQGQVIEKTVPIGVLDAAKARAIKGQTSCGCTSLVLPSLLSDDRHAIVTVVLDSLAKSPNVHEQVALSVDPSGQNASTCDLFAHVEKKDELPVVIGPLTPGLQPVSIDIPFLREEGEWSISCPGLSVSTYHQTSDRLIVTGTMDVHDTPDGDLKSIRAESMGTTISTPILVKAKSSWTASPATLNFGLIHRHSHPTVSTTVFISGNEHLDVADVPRGFRARVFERAPGQWSLSLTFESTPHRLLHSRIRLRRPRGQEIIIPVFAVSAD